MFIKLARFAGISLALLYAVWNLHHEYTLKFFHAGALNIAVWRSLNATEAQLTHLTSVPNNELRIPRHPERCENGDAKLSFPASCDFLGGDFGGKARNCDWWWLGRKCYVFYLPADIRRDRRLHARIHAALQQPCEVLYNGVGDDSVLQEGEVTFSQKARNAFGCDGDWLPMPHEVLVYVILPDGGHERVSVTMHVDKAGDT